LSSSTPQKMPILFQSLLLTNDFRLNVVTKKLTLILAAVLIMVGCQPSPPENSGLNAALNSDGLISPGSPETENVQGDGSTGPETSAPDWSQEASPSEIDKCKVPDGQNAAAWQVHEGTLVDGKRARGNIGFPLSPTTLPVSGESNLIAAMVSFDDAPPSDLTPAGYLQPQLDKIVEWGEFWSQGELSFNFQLVDEWIHIPVDHADYPVNRRLSFSEKQGNANKIIKLITAQLPDDLDYEGLDGVLVYWSPGVKSFEGDLGLQGFEGVALPFPQGPKDVFFWSGNAWWYEDSGTMTAEIKADHTWSFWIYLMLDSMGLHNHGPGNGWPNGLQQSEVATEKGFSGALLGWDEFKLGWTRDSQVHCMAPEDLAPESRFMLQAREVYGGDRRLAVVPFQDEGALVIESRRPTGWSSDWPETRTGLLAYFVDTELEIDRVDSFTEAGCGSSPDQPKWAYHLFKDEFSGDCRSFDNAFLRSGETLSFNGVQITLVHSTETVDYVEVSTQNR